MSEGKKTEPAKGQPRPHRRAARPAQKADHVAGATGPSGQRPPRIRVVGGDGGEERLTAEELKERFAINLTRLLRLLGGTRKEAALEIGVGYKLLRRLASAGVSVAEERNAATLARLADFFALPGVEYLWRADLRRLLLTTPAGAGFVARFRERLQALRDRRLEAARMFLDDEEVVLIGRALGVDDATPAPLPGPDAEKVAAILASPKASTFRRVIADYFELVDRGTSGSNEEHAGRG